jgi:general secretion pathway protein K
MKGARISRGIAMVLAIVVLAILSVVVLQLVFTTRVEVALSQNSRDEHESDRAADAAVELARIYLKSEDRERPDLLDDPWAVKKTGIKLGHTAVDMEIFDEERKFNIRLLLSENEGVRDWAEAVLLRLVKLAREREEDAEEELDPEKVVERIVDWARKGETGQRSAPGEQRAGEEAADLRLITIAELLFLEGITHRMVFGEKPAPGEEEEEAAESASEDSLDAEEEEEEENIPLADVLTVHGDGRVNINTAPKEVLMALHEGITEEVADKILEAREAEPGAEGEDGSAPPPPTAPPPPGDGAASEDPTAAKGFQTVAELRSVEGMVQQDRQLDILGDLLRVTGKTPRTGKGQTEDYRDAPLRVRSRFFRVGLLLRSRTSMRRVTAILWRTQSGEVSVLRRGEGEQ